MTRSSASVKNKGHVLQEICIICQRKVKYTRVKGKTIEDELNKAVTITGTLTDTAEAKGDNCLLRLNGGHIDLVAREARYHRSCFKDYTRKQSR